MRAIIQRVTKASVTVGDELISSIGKGLCILIGISRDDTPKEREYLARKILNLRLFDDDSGKRWAQSAKDRQLEILCVSQFTLYSILKGNKPDFHQAMGGDQSEVFYNEFLDMLRKDYDGVKIKDGKFGAHMQVHIQNDGPVTIQLECPPDVVDQEGAEDTPSSKARQSRQSGSKTPVAVVKAIPIKNKQVEKAAKYVGNFGQEFPPAAATQTREQFLQAVNSCREGSTSLPEMMLSVTTLLCGHRELLCSLTGFLPPGHTIGIMNNDPSQVCVRIPGQRSGLNREDLTQLVESLRSNPAAEENQRPPPDLAGLNELVAQFSQLST